ncbi:hypothetical protein Tco_0712371 [Tanacetum coccineum]
MAVRCPTEPNPMVAVYIAEPNHLIVGGGGEEIEVVTVGWRRWRVEESGVGDQGLDDEGQGLDDEGQGLDDAGRGLEDEGPGMEEEEEEAAPEGQQQAVLVVDTTASEPLGLRYEVARSRALESTEEIAPSTYEVGQSSRSVPEQEGVERISTFRQPTLVTWVDLEDGRVYTNILTYAPPAAPVQTLPSPEWSFGSLPVSPSSLVVPSPIVSPVTIPAATILVDEDQFLERENHDFRRQLAEERHKWLELTNHVARIERR